MDRELNNKVILCGESMRMEYDFSYRGENYYRMILRVERNSGASDYLPVIIPERIEGFRVNISGKYVSIKGEIRTRDYPEDGKRKCMVYVFAQEFSEMESESHVNSVELNGFICKNPEHRKTPLRRDITDVIIAVNRVFIKSDYIPCIMWGRNAIHCEKLPVGTELKVTGRMQSRPYKKTIDDNISEERIAYELSISEMYIADRESGGSYEQ